MPDEDFSAWRKDPGRESDDSPPPSEHVPREFPEEPYHDHIPPQHPVDERTAREVYGSLLRCPQCGYNLTGARIGEQCPECGLRVGSGLMSVGQPTSGKAVASLVLGIVSIMGCASYGLLSIVCGPLALYFARKARQEMISNEASASSASIATAGYVTGIIGTILGLIAVFFFLLFFGIGFLGLLA
jgi:hypothetical protein